MQNNVLQIQILDIYIFVGGFSIVITAKYFFFMSKMKKKQNEMNVHCTHIAAIRFRSFLGQCESQIY